MDRHGLLLESFFSLSLSGNTTFPFTSKISQKTLSKSISSLLLATTYFINFSPESIREIEKEKKRRRKKEMKIKLDQTSAWLSSRYKNRADRTAFESISRRSSFHRARCSSCCSSWSRRRCSRNSATSPTLSSSNATIYPSHAPSHRPPFHPTIHFSPDLKTSFHAIIYLLSIHTYTYIYICIYMYRILDIKKPRTSRVRLFILVGKHG